MKSEIQFVDVKELQLPYLPEWWDKPRWWLVRLLGGKCPLDTVKVTRIPVGGKDFMERLWKQRRTLVESFNREPLSLWMGAEDYEELMDSPPIRQALTVHAQFNWGRNEIYGLTVKVIPWMRGMMVMPYRD